ncbi:MFS transporter [Phycicoccus sp. CSK15P-2]|uniref:MFS transporter n=1 Tax=Phycicoccus sp. CSK15P-2 TaxID=2807627 RepID=UPI0019515EB8|nr:MFS transporter [Phycicoccus sp. CSK15P-2]MBM6403249.1 MFS transporter [Phycicoccus sp. CSK15P-2]
MSDTVEAPPPREPPPGTPSQPRRLTLRAFWAALPPAGRWLLSTIAISTLGRGLTLPFTVIYIHEVRGVPLDVAGALMALIGVVAVVVTAPVGILTDRLGARRVVVAGLLAQVLGVTVIAFASSVPVLAVALGLLGVSFGAGRPASSAMIASIVGGRLRVQYFGVNFALVNLGIGVGGVIGGFVADVDRPGTFTAVFLADAVCLLVPVVLLLGPLRRVAGRVPASDDSPAGAGYLAILRRPAVLWVTALTFLTSFAGYGQLETGFPAFARQVSEVSTRTVGLAFAANTAVIVLMQFLVLRLIDGHRRTRVLLVLGGVWVASWLLLGSTGVVSGTLAASAGVVLFLALFGLGETLLQPTVPAIVNDLASERDRGRYNAVSAMAMQMGAVTAPVVAGLMLDRRLGGMFVALLLGCLLVVAGLALALERSITAEVNGVTDT